MAEDVLTKPNPRRRAPARPPTGPARFFSESGTTSSEALYCQLHEAIVSMELLPGTPISESHLAAENGVSRTPVREAIKRLAKEKLVETVAKSGTFVGRIPISSLIEASLIRRTLELEMARCATARLTAADIAKLRRCIQQQKHAFRDGEIKIFHQRDEEFHQTISVAAGYEGIWDHIQQVKVQLDRYRQLTLPQAGRIEKTIDEHKAILAAMERGDPSMVAAALEFHLGKLSIDLQILRQKWPNYFIHDIET